MNNNDDERGAGEVTLALTVRVTADVATWRREYGIDADAARDMIADDVPDMIRSAIAQATRRYLLNDVVVSATANPTAVDVLTDDLLGTKVETAMTCAQIIAALSAEPISDAQRAREEAYLNAARTAGA